MNAKHIVTASQSNACTGVGKFCDFRLKSPFVSQTVQDSLMVVNRKSSTAYRSVSFPVTLSDPERQETRNQFFRWISLITLVPFDIERQTLEG